ncbi:uncharacterized protein LOC129614163 [Condylostylus longicornis]|uniref:uncharacterized protein LOC129614163 n=1 Tax=Condylostylus longicornis TaxID=2530218 RepID=UPI00244E1AAE|nr:uncharacterized protein LOC129614163 [Condylostylus longicornis]
MIFIYNFFKRGIRGGISQCSKTYSKANSKYMGNEYDSNKPSEYITYLDANNLYGWAMFQLLPYGSFKWLDNPSDFQVNEISDDSEFKNFFKLMNNTVYGKTMENVDKRKIVKISNSWEGKRKHPGARQLIMRPNFHSISIFNEDLSTIQLNKVEVVYDKPIYLGFTVLKLSKYHMYNFHYNYMKSKYGLNINLNYMLWIQIVLYTRIV